MKRKVFIITGKRGVGKSTVCRKVFNLVYMKNHKPAGIISPPIYDSEGNKVGIMLENLITNEQWLLALTNSNTNLEGPFYGLYKFSREGLNKAINILKEAFQSGCDLIVLDEIGPLELEKGDGFKPIIELFTYKKDMILLIVVRPSLIKEFQYLIGNGQVTIFTVTLENRDTLPTSIVEDIRKG